MANAEPFVEGRLKHCQIVVFSKSYSPEGKICQNILQEYNRFLPDDAFEWIDIEKRSDCPQVEDYLWLLSGKNRRDVPLLFVKKRCIGGYDEIVQMHNEGKLGKLLRNLSLDDDDDNEDSIAGNDVEACQVTVRVEELDSTEILIKVLDSFGDADSHADYNVSLEKASLMEIQDMFKQEVEERAQKRFISKDSIAKVPVWLPVATSRTKISVAMILSRETSRFIMTRSLSAEITKDLNACSSPQEQTKIY